MEVQPQKQINTSLKDEIERTFIITSRCAATLKNNTMCKCPGNKTALFRNFVGHFDYLFHISCLKNDAGGDQNTIKECEAWFNSNKSKPTIQHIMKGLKLFRCYGKELYARGLLVYE